MRNNFSQVNKDIDRAPVKYFAQFTHVFLNRNKGLHFKYFLTKINQILKWSKFYLK